MSACRKKPYPVNNRFNTYPMSACCRERLELVDVIQSWHHIEMLGAVKPPGANGEILHGSSIKRPTVPAPRTGPREMMGRPVSRD